MMSIDARLNNRIVEGKSVLITGAFGGIGLALVDAFLDAGVDRILATSRIGQSPTNDRVTSIILDVCSPNSVAAVADSHDIDILINNSGVNENASLLSNSAAASARAEMEANYFGVLNMCCAIAPRMIARGSGVIVNMLSSSAHKVVPRMASYCASKAAAASLTQSLRSELRDKGVDVIAIFPSATDTRLTAHLSIPKLSPAAVADATISAIRQGVTDQFVHLENSGSFRKE
jgi:short-subunit dehydrogenase